jgi:hypothetical protein
MPSISTEDDGELLSITEWDPIPESPDCPRRDAAPESGETEIILRAALMRVVSAPVDIVIFIFSSAHTIGTDTVRHSNSIPIVG